MDGHISIGVVSDVALLSNVLSSLLVTIIFSPSMHYMNSISSLLERVLGYMCCVINSMQETAL